MTNDELAAVITDAITNVLNKVLGPVLERIERLERIHLKLLEAEVSRLEQRHTPKDTASVVSEEHDRHVMPREAAAMLIAILERAGAVFSVKPDGHFLCDLNGIPDYNHEKAETMSKCVLALRDEIRAELHSRRTTH